MKRIAKAAVLLASGMVFGAIAGKIAIHESVRVKRKPFSRSTNRVNGYLEGTGISGVRENINEYFI